MRRGQLSGTGRGQRATYDPGGGTNVPATMILAGVPDADPPTLSLAAGGDLADPWTPLWVVASEPLPVGQPAPALRSTGGDFLSFAAQSNKDPFVVVFARPTRMLRFGDQYRVTFDGITDFAGHAPTSAASATFTTRAPAAAGRRGRLRIGHRRDAGRRADPVRRRRADDQRRPQPLPSPRGFARDGVDGHAVRAARPDRGGQHGRALRLPDRQPRRHIQRLLRGRERGRTDRNGGPARGRRGRDDARDHRSDAVTLGPIQTATIGLPASTYVEVVLARTASQPTSCGGPAPRPVPGLILDDLRAE